MRMAERLATAGGQFNLPDQDDALLWPVNEAIAAGFAVDEFDVGARDIPQPADVDITAILALVTGSLFGDIEAKAAFGSGRGSAAHGAAVRVPPRPLPTAPPTWPTWWMLSGWHMPTCRRSGRWFCRRIPCCCSSGSLKLSLLRFACPKPMGAHCV